MHSKHTQLLYRHLFNYCADTQGVIITGQTGPVTDGSLTLLVVGDTSEAREGGRGRLRERQSGEALSDFQVGDFR